jgi:hypothetical protein
MANKKALARLTRMTLNSIDRRLSKAERWDAAILALNACDAVAEMEERED